jgi:quercetin dioxygenase-like cupin family protein
VTVSVPTISAQDRKTETKELLRTDLGDWCPGKEVLVTVSLNSAGVAARHFHPAHSYSYLLEGSQTISPDGKPSYAVKAGDLQHEAPFEVSATRTTDPTKVLVVRILEKGKPATSLAP